MTALRKTGTVLLVGIVLGGVATATGASDFEAAPIRHTVLYDSDSVLGKELVASGTNAGRIVDVLTDGSGRVEAVVVDYGGFLGLGSRKVAVAWSDLRFPPGRADAVTTDIPREKLSEAPEVKAGKPVTVISGRNRATEDGGTRN